VSTALPAPFRGLVDDAAIFPPGDLPLPEAVTAHEGHRQATYADLVASFVVSDEKLPRLTEMVSTSRFLSLSKGSTTRGTGPLPLSVVVSGGAGAIEPAVVWADRIDGVDLRALETAVRDSADGNLAHNARRVVTAVDGLLTDVPVYAEPPRLSGAAPRPAWLDALDAIAAADLRLKFRTGGLEADAFPSATELATCIAASLDRELAFKCTAGLHHAVRHRDQATGFEHHGFLNVLLATRASLDGATSAEVADLLDEKDPAAVVKLLGEVGDDGLVSARRWFTSFGSCSVLEPLEDLTRLGLVPEPVA